MARPKHQRQTSYQYINNESIIEASETELKFTEKGNIITLPVVKWYEIQGMPYRVKPSIKNLQSNNVWVKMPTTLKGDRRLVNKTKDNDKKDYAINYGKDYLIAYMTNALIIPVTSYDGTNKPQYDPESTPELLHSLLNEVFAHIDKQVSKHGITAYTEKLPQFWE